MPVVSRRSFERAGVTVSWPPAVYGQRGGLVLWARGDERRDGAQADERALLGGDRRVRLRQVLSGARGSVADPGGGVANGGGFAMAGSGYATGKRSAACPVASSWRGGLQRGNEARTTGGGSGSHLQ